MRTVVTFFLIATFACSAALGYLVTPRLGAAAPALLKVPCGQEASIVEARLLAVDSHGEGVVATLEVEVRPGNGHLFLKTDAHSPYYYLDTQSSLKTAYEIAAKFAEVNMTAKDVYYSVGEGLAEKVSGGSAGAGVTVATVAALRGESLRPDRMITGTINSDGEIGRVAGVLAKAKAAKGAGAAMLVVPLGERTQAVEEQSCTSSGVCTTNMRIVDVQQEANITVSEAADIEQAYELMRG